MTRKALLFAAVASLVTIGEAQAADFTVCTPSSLRSCASFQVTTNPAVVNGNDVIQVVLRARNLQGFIADDNTGGSSIYAIGLVSENIAMDALNSDFAHSATGSASQVGSPSWAWFENYPFSLFVEVPFGDKGAILGCDVAGLFDSSAPDPAYYETCDDGATNPWVTFTFNTQNTWNPANVQIGFQSQTANGGDVSCVSSGAIAADDAFGPFGGSETCVAPRGGPPPVTVTPEPVSMVLLGSGLLGLGFVRRRRRRLVESADAV